MYEAIKNFNKQFSFKPEIINKENLKNKSSFIVIGMGGSALAPLLLKRWKSVNIIIDRDYSLPKISLEKLRKKLIILSSYSGNTEETISVFKEAKRENLDIAVISTGGKLLSLAKENNLPYIELPNTGIQPRSALGFSVIAFLKLIGEEKEIEEISKLTDTLNPIVYEEEGKNLSKKIKDFVPVIYSSNHNMPIAYNWKIKINETGKIPSFYNVFPELNHNEMTGFDVENTTTSLSSGLYFIILKDAEDNERIIKRMDVLEKLYKDKKLKIESIEIKGENVWQKIFSSLILADWFSYYTALEYGLEPEQVPMVEKFKKMILE